MDVLKELWGHQNFTCILYYTKPEALWQINNEFSITKQELDAFFGLYLFREVFKGKTNHYQAFGNPNIDDPFFVKQCQVICFNFFLDIFDLTIKNLDQIAEEQTSLLLFENYEAQ